jgi:hypothetical protein
MSNPASTTGIAQAACASKPSTHKALPEGAFDFDAIVELAREAGMLVTLDGQIGRQKYESIAGSLTAFRRFVDALHGSLAEQLTA